MQNEMIETIEEHGIDLTSKILAEYINQKIPSEDMAMQFVLEELEAASQGNERAKLFASTSGFDEDDYEGAMRNSFEEVDGIDGPQQLILNLCMMLYPDQNLMAELRIKTVDNIMKEWQIGKYSAVNNEIRLIDIVQKRNNLDDGIFANINNDLNESITQDNDVMILMAYGYARRTVAAGLYLQGVLNRENYMQASRIFKSLQLQTGQSVEFQEEAASQSIELLLSYSSRLTKTMINKITSVVELDQVECAYENNIYYSFDKTLDFFEDKNDGIDTISDNWMEKLWDWADENYISDYQWYEDDAGNSGYSGFPRDSNTLMKITELDLRNNDLTDIPKEICMLTNIEAIFLNSNKLKILPKEIGSLTNLTSLFLSDNNLVSLPKEICKLSKLEFLGLGRNKLAEIPNEIHNLKNLKVLDISQNKLLKLPKEIIYLSLHQFLFDKNISLSMEQKHWLDKLHDLGCNIKICSISNKQV